MTLKMYAGRKGWDLREVTVHVSHAKTHGEDCLACESKNGKIDSFSREVEIVGELNDEQRSRLLEIADKCPVHKTLESSSNIKTGLIN